MDDFNPFGEPEVNAKEEKGEKNQEEKEKKKKKKDKKKKKKDKSREVDYGDCEEVEYEMCMLDLEESFLYQVPPKQVTSGFISADWTLGKPLFTGRLKVMEKGNILYLAFFKEKEEMFLKSVDLKCIEIGSKRPLISFLQKVKDSSRYFVFKVQDPRNGRLANFGVGFRERDRAFDFEAVIQEKIDQVHRDAKLAAELKAEAEKEEVEEESFDFSLKGPINVNIGNKSGSAKPRKDGVSAMLGGLSLGAPPVGGDDDSDSDEGKEDGDDDWGDFSAA